MELEMHNLRCVLKHLFFCVSHFISLYLPMRCDHLLSRLAVVLGQHFLLCEDGVESVICHSFENCNLYHSEITHCEVRLYVRSSNIYVVSESNRLKD